MTPIDDWVCSMIGLEYWSNIGSVKWKDEIQVDVI